MKQLLTYLLLFVISGVVSAQNVLFRNDSIVVHKEGKTLALPWATGLNSAHISRIDLNFDGVLDLFIFEPNVEYNPLTGDKIFTFINNGTSGVADYKYAPEYAKHFPRMERFALLRDYNCDGKMDIFTHDDRDKITVYKNVTALHDTVNIFELEQEILHTSAQGYPSSYPFFDEIYWNYEDMISVTDIDNDGDLDILTIDFSGYFVEYHKNMSMESNFGCDSLLFELKNTCWGEFGEDQNTVVLDTCNPYGNVGNPEKEKPPVTNGKVKKHGSSKGAKHSSTALLALDLDGDNVKDLVAGDFSSKSLTMLMNNGTTTSSHMNFFSYTFPIQDPVDLSIYVMPFYEDVNNDGKNDFIATVRSSGIFQNTNSVWMYSNSGTTNNPVLSLTTESFLQEDMIDVGQNAHPVFFDYNNDSLVDIVIGNYGYFESLAFPLNNYDSKLALYENVGTSTLPEFEFVTDDFAGLSSLNLDVVMNQPTLGLHPTFGDLNGDGHQDMIVGDYNGMVHYFINTPNGAVSEFTLKEVDFEGIDVGESAHPQLFDLNDDGLLDLIIGEKDGNINYYENTGSDSVPEMTLIEDTLGNVNTKEYWDFWGYSSPFFYRDSANVLRLLCGSKSGHIQLYDSIFTNGNLNANFNLADDDYQNIWEGIYTSIHGMDITNDGSFDFIIGNESGGVSLFTADTGTYQPPPWVGIDEEVDIDLSFNLYPNPSKDLVYIDLNKEYSNLEIDIMLIDITGNIVHQQSFVSNDPLDVSEFARGVYFVKLTVSNSNETAIKKLILQ